MYKKILLVLIIVLPVIYWGYNSYTQDSSDNWLYEDYASNVENNEDSMGIILCNLLEDIQTNTPLTYDNYLSEAERNFGAAYSYLNTSPIAQELTEEQITEYPKSELNESCPDLVKEKWNDILPILDRDATWYFIDYCKRGNIPPILLDSKVVGFNFAEELAQAGDEAFLGVSVDDCVRFTG